MMSFITRSEWEIAKKQCKYKLKSSSLLFIAVIVAQVVSLLLSFNAMTMYMTNGTSLSLSISTISSNMVIFFTLLVIFFLTFSLTSIEWKNIDFTFVSNRLTSHISNIWLLLTLCLFGAVTSVVCGVLLRVVSYFQVGPTSIANSNFLVSFGGWLMLLVVTFLYLLFTSSISYFFGTLMQYHKLLAVVVAVGVVGMFLSEARTSGQVRVINFFITETSLFMFALKVIVSVLFLLGISLFITNRVEVRK